MGGVRPKSPIAVVRWKRGSQRQGQWVAGMSPEAAEDRRQKRGKESWEVKGQLQEQVRQPVT